MHIAAQTDQMIEHQIMKKSYYFYCNYIFGLNVGKTYYTCHAKFGFFFWSEWKKNFSLTKGFEKKCPENVRKKLIAILLLSCTHIYTYMSLNHKATINIYNFSDSCEQNVVFLLLFRYTIQMLLLSIAYVSAFLSVAFTQIHSVLSHWTCVDYGDYFIWTNNIFLNIKTFLNETHAGICFVNL